MKSNKTDQNYRASKEERLDGVEVDSPVYGMVRRCYRGEHHDDRVGEDDDGDDDYGDEDRGEFWEEIEEGGESKEEEEEEEEEEEGEREEEGKEEDGEATDREWSQGRRLRRKESAFIHRAKAGHGRGGRGEMNERPG